MLSGSRPSSGEVAQILRRVPSSSDTDEGLLEALSAVAATFRPVALPMRIWKRYQRLARMPSVPKGNELQAIFQRRKLAGAGADEETTLASMLDELEDVQKSIDNRAEAILKVGAFLGTGLAVLTKLDTQVSAALGVAVVLLSGFSLGGALLAQNPPAYRAVILAPPTFDDLEQSCHQLVRNQKYLGLASMFTGVAIVLSLVAVTSSLV
jgi:hypothetical protein